MAARRTIEARFRKWHVSEEATIDQLDTISKCDASGPLEIR